MPRRVAGQRWCFRRLRGLQSNGPSTCQGLPLQMWTRRLGKQSMGRLFLSSERAMANRASVSTRCSPGVVGALSKLAPCFCCGRGGSWPITSSSTRCCTALSPNSRFISAWAKMLWSQEMTRTALSSWQSPGLPSAWPTGFFVRRPCVHRVCWPDALDHGNIDIH